MTNCQSSCADGLETNGECIICMSEYRDTLILPCRHLCVCSSCAGTLRYKVSISKVLLLQCKSYCFFSLFTFFLLITFCNYNGLIINYIYLQANCCPICRSPFRALLQIEMVQLPCIKVHSNVSYFFKISLINIHYLGSKLVYSNYYFLVRNKLFKPRTAIF